MNQMPSIIALGKIRDLYRGLPTPVRATIDGYVDGTILPAQVPANQKANIKAFFLACVPITPDPYLKAELQAWAGPL